MASFVETATLKVVNQSSKEIRKINKDLAGLFRTMNKASKQVMRPMQIRVDSRQVGTATRNLTALQNQANRTRKAIQNVGNVRVRAGGSAGGRPVPGGAGNQRVILDYGGFRGFAHGFMTRLGTTIETAIINGFKTGVRDTDLAQNRQRILGFTPEQRRQNNRTATEIAAQNPQFSRAQVLGVIGEVAPSVGNDLNATRQVTESVLEYSKALMAAGATSEEATDNLQKLSKAMGMTGTLLDNAGNFDAGAMQRFMDVVVQETITGGREMVPELIAQLAKYSRTTGKTLNQEGWRTLLFLGEDYGSSAGVGLNQMVKQLTGERIQKKQLARLMELGLMGSKEVKSGTVGGKIKTETVSTGVVDEMLLRSDPAKWVRDVLMPIMEKNGFDAADNVQAAKFAGQITSDRTATDILTTLITNMGEVEQRARIAEQRGNVNLDEVLGDSLVASWNSTMTQLTSAAGEVGYAFKDVLIPALNSVGNVARNVAAFVSGDSGDANLLTGAAVGGGALAAGFAGYKALGALSDMFGLKGSAVALNGSAAALTRAAVSLGGSGVVGDIVDGPDGKPKGKGRFGRPGRLAMGVGAATSIGTALLVADQVAFDGAATEQASKNLNYLDAFMTAVGKLMNEQFRSEDDFSWKRFLFGIAADPNYEGFAQHTRNIFNDKEPDVVAQFGQEVANGAREMQTAIDTSTVSMTNGIATAATEFGPAAGAGLMQVATSWGTAAAAAFRNAVGTVPVNVNTTPAVDTGAANNGAR